MKFATKHVELASMCSIFIIVLAFGEEDKKNLRFVRYGNENMKLNGFVIGNYYVDNASDCALRCSLVLNCLSFNLRTVGSNNYCELNKESADGVGKLLSSAVGGQHFVTVRPEDPGIYAADSDEINGIWFYLLNVNGKDWCFMFSNNYFNGTKNWKGFGTTGINITSMVTQNDNNTSYPSVKFSLYLGDGTMITATLDTGVGGDDFSKQHYDSPGTSWSFGSAVDISNVHGLSAPPLVEASLTIINITYLFYRDTVFELKAGDPLGSVQEVYSITSTISRNPFVNGPKGITAARMQSYPVAHLFKGLRWVIYNVATKSYVGYGSITA